MLANAPQKGNLQKAVYVLAHCKGFFWNHSNGTSNWKKIIAESDHIEIDLHKRKTYGKLLFHCKFIFWNYSVIFIWKSNCRIILYRNWLVFHDRQWTLYGPTQRWTIVLCIWFLYYEYEDVALRAPMFSMLLIKCFFPVKTDWWTNKQRCAIHYH